MIASKSKLGIVVVLAMAMLSPSKASAWGADGHAIMARIAELNLSPTAKTALQGLLPDTPFSNSSSISDTKLASFADFVRHNSQFPQYKESAPWHFVDIPIGPNGDAVAYDPAEHCKDGQCALDRIESFKAILADTTATKSKRQESLVFIVHLVGDLHQPLHCATRNDRGGNDVKVTYLGRRGQHLNLHSVWDDNLVRENMIGFDPHGTADKMNEQITDANRTAWRQKTTKDWMLESYELARTSAYRLADNTVIPTEGVVDLDQAYVEMRSKVVLSQLKKGGVRLAQVLNTAFAKTE